MLKNPKLWTTMFPFITSSANSNAVQCVTGRCDFSGGSQATAMIIATWSASNLQGRPGRWLSLKRVLDRPAKLFRATQAFCKDQFLETRFPTPTLDSIRVTLIAHTLGDRHIPLPFKARRIISAGTSMP
jgi:hypothetical protein